MGYTQRLQCSSFLVMTYLWLNTTFEPLGIHIYVYVKYMYIYNICIYGIHTNSTGHLVLKEGSEPTVESEGRMGSVPRG